MVGKLEYLTNFQCQSLKEKHCEQLLLPIFLMQCCSYSADTHTRKWPQREVCLRRGNCSLKHENYFLVTRAQTTFEDDSILYLSNLKLESSRMEWCPWIRRKFTFSKTVLSISFDLTLFSLFLGAKSNSGWGLKASQVLVRLSCFVCARNLEWEKNHWPKKKTLDCSRSRIEASGAFLLGPL